MSGATTGVSMHIIQGASPGFGQILCNPKYLSKSYHKCCDEHYLRSLGKVLPQALAQILPQVSFIPRLTTGVCPGLITGVIPCRILQVLLITNVNQRLLTSVIRV